MAYDNDGNNSVNSYLEKCPEQLRFLNITVSEGLPRFPNDANPQNYLLLSSNALRASSWSEK